jgi:hypothetical protein
MAGVDENEIRAKHEQRVAATDLSATAIAKHEEALRYLVSKGFSHDYASELLRQKGADVVLDEMSASLIPEPEPEPAPEPTPVSPVVESEKEVDAA